MYNKVIFFNSFIYFLCLTASTSQGTSNRTRARPKRKEKDLYIGNENPKRSQKLFKTPKDDCGDDPCCSFKV